MMRRRVRVAEHYHIAWDVTNLQKKYEFYDQSRDTMFVLRWSDLYHASQPDWTQKDVRDYWTGHEINDKPRNTGLQVLDGDGVVLSPEIRTIGSWLGIFPYQDNDPDFSTRPIKIIFTAVDGQIVLSAEFSTKQGPGENLGHTAMTMIVRRIAQFKMNANHTPQWLLYRIYLDLYVLGRGKVLENEDFTAKMIYNTANHVTEKKIMMQWIKKMRRAAAPGEAAEVEAAEVEAEVETAEGAEGETAEGETAPDRAAADGPPPLPDNARWPH